MKDRIPTYPGRVRLVPVTGETDLYTLTRADEPTQEGTPLNKNSLLKDSTAAAMELTGEDPTVDDALASIAGRFTMVRSGTTAPDASTEAKRGDIYIEDDGGPERHVWFCNAVGNREIDTGAAWERGGIGSRGVNAAADYRVRSDMVSLPAGCKLSVASGFRFALWKFDDDANYISAVSLRTSAFTVTTATRARLLIARVTEDTTETADVAEFSAALTVALNGTHWSAMASAREVRKTVIFTSDDYFTVPDDLRGAVTVRAFGGGAGGENTGTFTGYGGGGGHMAVWTGTLTEKKYPVRIGKGGFPGRAGGASSFGNLVTAAGASGQSGGTGGGGGQALNAGGGTGGGSGSYGGGGGSAGSSSGGGGGGTYGGGGGGAYGTAGGSGKNASYAGGAGKGSFGGGGGGWSVKGTAATTSAPGTGGAGLDTTGFGLDFEGVGTGGATSGGGGGYGGRGGAGYRGSGATSSIGGGGGGYGADGGNASVYSGGGGGGFGGPGGNGSGSAGGGGGGYGLSGSGGTLAGYESGMPEPPYGNGGIAAGGAPDCKGGDGIVIVTYTGIEVV